MNITKFYLKLTSTFINVPPEDQESFETSLQIFTRGFLKPKAPREMTKGEKKEEECFASIHKNIPKLKNLLSENFDPTDLSVSSVLSLMEVTFFSSDNKKKEIFKIKKINLEIQYDFSNFATLLFK